MLITLTKTHNTTKTETWLIETSQQLHRITTQKHPKRRGIDNLRYVICKALRIDASAFRFLGNRRVNGQWFTEWMVL